MSDMEVMPEIPMPTNKAEWKLYHGIQDIVNRVTLRALAHKKHDLLLSVYVAGLYHGYHMAKGQPTPNRAPAHGD